MRPWPALSLVVLLRGAPALGAEAGPAPAGAAAPTNATPSGASACTDKPEVCGRDAFGRGVKAYRDGDFQTAIVEFRAAEAYKAHPSIELNLGLAEARVGQYLAAIREFDSVLANPASDDKLRDQATKERDRALAELAAIDLDVGGGAPPPVWIDGEARDAHAPIRVDPGPHHVEVEIGGANVVRDLTLAPREHLMLSIDRTHEIVVVQKRAPETAPGAPPPPPPPPPPPARHGIRPVWFFVGAGAAVAAGVVATWSALDTKSAYDAYQRDLPNLTQEQANARVDDGHGLQTRTNVLFGVTGVLAVAAAGIGIFLVDWGPSTESALAVGPGGVAYVRRF